MQRGIRRGSSAGDFPVSRSNAQTPKVTGLWKTMWAGLILDDSRIVRYEHGVTA